MNQQGRRGGDEQKRIRQGAPPEHRHVVGPAVAHVKHLEQDHRRQGYGLRVRDRTALIQFPPEEHQGPGGHDESGHRGALPEQPRHDTFGARTWKSVQHAGIAGLEGQRHILQAVGDQVEPQELGRQHRERPPHSQCRQDHHDRRGTRGYEKERHLSQVVEGNAAFFDRCVDTD